MSSEERSQGRSEEMKEAYERLKKITEGKSTEEQLDILEAIMNIHNQPKSEDESEVDDE